MNIYCYECEKELEIKKDINTEIHVFGHVCEQDASLIAAMQARIEKLETAASNAVAWLHHYPSPDNIEEQMAENARRARCILEKALK